MKLKALVLIVSFISVGQWVSSCKKSSKTIPRPKPSAAEKGADAESGSCLALTSVPKLESVDPATLTLSSVTFEQDDVAGFKRGLITMTAKEGSAYPDTFYYEACQVNDSKNCVKGTTLSGIAYNGNIGAGNIKVSGRACVYPERASVKSESRKIVTSSGTTLYCGNLKEAYGKQDENSSFGATVALASKEQKVEEAIKQKCQVIYDLVKKMNPGSNSNLRSALETVINLGPEAFCQRLRTDFLATIQALGASENFLQSEGAGLALAGDDCFDEEDEDRVNKYVSRTPTPAPNFKPPVFDDKLPPAPDEPKIDDKEPTEDPKDPTVTDNDAGEKPTEEPTEEKEEDHKKSVAATAVMVVGAIAATGGALTFAMTTKDGFLYDKIRKNDFLQKVADRFKSKKASPKTPEIDEAVKKTVALNTSNQEVFKGIMADINAEGQAIDRYYKVLNDPDLFSKIEAKKSLLGGLENSMEELVSAASKEKDTVRAEELKRKIQNLENVLADPDVKKLSDNITVEGKQIKYLGMPLDEVLELRELSSAGSLEESKVERLKELQAKIAESGKMEFANRIKDPALRQKYLINLVALDLEAGDAKKFAAEQVKGVKAFYFDNGKALLPDDAKKKLDTLEEEVKSKGALQKVEEGRFSELTLDEKGLLQKYSYAKAGFDQLYVLDEGGKYKSTGLDTDVKFDSYIKKLQNVSAANATQKGDWSSRSWFSADNPKLKYAQIGGLVGMVAGVALMIGASAMVGKEAATANEEKETPAEEKLALTGSSALGLSTADEELLRNTAYDLARLINYDISEEMANAYIQDAGR